MAHSHYVMDLYFPSSDKPGGLDREVLRIAALTDEEAAQEADRIGRWRHPVRYDVRAITKSARTGHRLVHSSAPQAEEVDTEQPADAAGTADPT